MNTFTPAPFDSPSQTSATTAPDWLKLTKRYVDELEYGQVILTIHQSQVIEVQKTERTRLIQPKRS